MIDKKIAFFSPVKFSSKLGATKNRIELANSLKDLGWETFLIGYAELNIDENSDRMAYYEGLKNYLIANAHKYDVVLYEYDTLPYDRTLFSKNTLFIARPALLHYNLEKHKIPLNLKSKLASHYHSLLKRLRLKKGVLSDEKNKRSFKSLTECDIIQVQNNIDANLLQERGFKKSKIIIVPNGISKKRLSLFNSDSKNYDSPFTIAFVGTFDFRKGAMDFPYIVTEILKQYPDCKFKLLGTKGIFVNEDEVRNFFPKRLRNSLSIQPTFEPDDLPSLLKDCQLGIFPSYFESFGFGALEMMAAGLPVVGYKSPGPSDFLIDDLLIAIGDKKSLAKKVREVLSNKNELVKLGSEARNIAKKYDWDIIAKKGSEFYLAQLKTQFKRL